MDINMLNKIAAAAETAIRARKRLMTLEACRAPVSEISSERTRAIEAEALIISLAQTAVERAEELEASERRLRSDIS